VYFEFYVPCSFARMIFGFQGQLPLPHGQLPLLTGSSRYLTGSYRYLTGSYRYLTGSYRYLTGSYRYLKRYRYSRALCDFTDTFIFEQAVMLLTDKEFTIIVN
jgi:hypothetical protein